MKFQDINPYIRYAKVNTTMPINAFVRTYDSRLFYILSGSFELDVGDTTYSIKNDTLMLWRAGMRYRFRNNAKIQMIVFNFDYTQEYSYIAKELAPVPEADFKEKKLLSCEDFDDCDMLNAPVVLHGMSRLKPALLRVVEYRNIAKKYSNISASAKLKEALCEIASAELYSDEKQLVKINEVLKYLKANFKREISNAEIGRLTGYHPYHINRLVLKLTGQTIRQNLISIRIDTAKALLSETDMTVQEIATEAGFASTAYFDNLFKRHEGITPGLYREKFKNII